MFKTRLISGILLVIAALLTIISGGYVLFFTLLCISLIGMQELYKAMGVHKEQTEFLELASCPEFQDCYIDHLMFEEDMKCIIKN